MNINVHAYIAVTDLERGIEFYCQALSLRLRRRLDADWAELEGASTPIFLLVGSGQSNNCITGLSISIFSLTI